MIFVRGEVDKSQENYEVTAEVFLKVRLHRLFWSLEL